MHIRLRTGIFCFRVMIVDEQLVQALQICPGNLRDAVLRLAQKANLSVEELRLRVGKPAAVYAGGREWRLSVQGGSLTVSPELVAQVVACSLEYSVYNAQEQLRRGFFTIAGGHRIGICGEAVCEHGRLTTLKNFSSVNLRIAHEVRGAANGIIDLIWQDPRSVLILGPPGSGKTTVLRDTVRQLSDRLRCCIGLVDERYEIAAAVNGLPQLEVGCCTDLLSGAPKQEAVGLLLRTMRPEWIALDEITEEADLAAVTDCANCGVHLIATAHASSAEDLRSRSVYRKLLEKQVFGHFVRIDRDRSLHTERITL